MSNKNDSSERHYNSYYRNFIKKYSGDKGVLKSIDGTELPCKFETWQLENGNIILICDCSVSDLNIPKYFPEFNYENFSPFDLKVDLSWSIYLNEFNLLNKFNSFNGTTFDGFNITGKIRRFVNADYESLCDHTSRVKFEYSIKELDINAEVKGKLRFMTFGVTNFKFTGNESQGEILSLDMIETKRVTIKKIEKYKDALHFLKSTKGICITCEVMIEIDNETEIEKSIDIVSDLCDLMSIACGTKIQWIYFNICNTEGNVVSQKHGSRVTKPYLPLEIIDEKPLTMKNFLDTSYAFFVDNPERLKNNKYIMNTYLDSKAQNDYLEQRGIKLVVVTELFKELLLKIKPESKYIVEEVRFKKLKSKIKEALKPVFEQHNIDSNSRWKLYQNISGINRTPFKEILSEFCEHINLEVDDLQPIIDSRDSLVHTGKFLSQREIDKKYSQFQTPVSEYFYLLSFVDKCFLKLLGYRGLYYDWSNINEVKEKELE